MSHKTKPVALYHITTEANLFSIMSNGLVPMAGPISRAKQVKHVCVHLYTSAERAKRAFAADGDYRKMAQKQYGEDVRLHMIRVFMHPEEAVAFAEAGDNFTVQLVCRVPAANLQLLDDDMNPVSTEDNGP